MARNPIQFQSGLSLPAFLDQYGTEEQCRAALYQHRWPRGFVCPDCGNSTACRRLPSSQVVGDGLGCFRAFESPA